MNLDPSTVHTLYRSAGGQTVSLLRIDGASNGDLLDARTLTAGSIGAARGCANASTARGITFSTAAFPTLVFDSSNAFTNRAVYVLIIGEG